MNQPSFDRPNLVLTALGSVLVAVLLGGSALAQSPGVPIAPGVSTAPGVSMAPAGTTVKLLTHSSFALSPDVLASVLQARPVEAAIAP